MKNIKITYQLVRRQDTSYMRISKEKYIQVSTIFPRHQIWHLSYNLVTPLDGHSSRPKDHIRKSKGTVRMFLFQGTS